MFLISTEQAAQKGNARSERLLSIGNPSFNREVFHTSKDLPFATSEASEIAAFYPARTVLIERNAREKAIRQEIERADVAHFAMHYVADERSPLLSQLLLAEESPSAPKESDGVLQTQELYRLNLSRLRLVALSACQTGIERYYKGEGAIGLARAFQGAGIPLVVASLWPVESYPTKELMVRFHRLRKRDGLPTAQALQRAQTEMIHSQEQQLRNPHHWAAFAIIGGYADF
jgi:CHAT domain-containing protein